MTDLPLPDVDAGELRQRAVSGAKYSLVALGGRQALTLLVVFVLARLLGPEDYGVVSQASLYVALSMLLLDQGLGTALVQRARLTRTEIASVLWLNVATAVALLGLTLLLAPAAAAFFRTPELAGILRALSVTALLKGLSVVPQALLNRELRFRELAGCELASVVLGGVAGVAGALSGLSAYSIVAQAVVADLVLMAGCWGRVGRLPLRGSLRALRPLLRFSVNVMGGNVLNYVMRNLDNVLIGRVLGPAALAFYALSYRTMMLGVQNLTRVVNRVALPYYSRLQDDRRALGSQFLQATRLVSLASFPLMTGVVLAAPECVPLVFGPAWAPAIVPMQLLAVTGLRQSVTTLVGPLLAATGKPHWDFRLNLFTSACLVTSFFVGIRGGIVGVALAYGVAGLASSPVGILLVARLLRFSAGDYLRALLPAAAGSAAMAAAWLLVRGGVLAAGGGALAVLVVAGAAALLAYVAVLVLAWPGTVRQAVRLARRTGPPPSARGTDAVLRS